MVHFDFGKSARQEVSLKAGIRNFCLSETSLVLMLTFLLCVSGCVQQGPTRPTPPPESSRPPEPEMLEHEVLYSGETLALIASWYTGRSSNWTIIQEANPGLRPERINLGQIIRIPGYLVIQRQPLPRKLVQDSLGRGGRGKQPNDRVETGGDTGQDNRPQDPAGGDASFDALLNDAMTDKPGSLNNGSEGLGNSEPQVPNAPVDIPSSPPAGAPPVSEAPANSLPVVENSNVEPSSGPPPGAPTGSGAGSGDAEREKLLDELLTQ